MLTTFSSPFGRFRFLRMPYGINSASEVFQRAMEQIFAGYPCAVIVDDIIIGGGDMKEHEQNLRKVLDRAREVKLRLNPLKCKFSLTEVCYIGHVFTSKGLKPDPAKTKAIKEMPTPENVTALQRFLGMINYLGKFIPKFSELSAPLRELTCKDIQWCWLKQHQDAFDALKQCLISPPTLSYYDVQKPVTLTCDASQYGLGAACLQEGAPIAYSSRTLTQTEMRYAQIEKELLAVVFACTKFNDYIYGKQIQIETDHQPLVTILNKPIHSAPARLQRMMLRLQKYNFQMVYKKGSQMYLADTLSRAPTTSTDQHSDETADYEIMSIQQISSSRLTQLKEHTASDPELQKLSTVIMRGWPCRQTQLPTELRQYHPYRDELTLEDGIVMKGPKTVIPKSLQKDYIAILHRGHPGTEATKRRARGIVFWPTMTEDIEQETAACPVCNSTRPHQRKEPLKLHPVPDLPWSTVATDIFEWNGQHHLVVVDSYSGWFEVDLLRDLTANAVISKLKRHFSVHGCPHTVISDNGTQFTSQRFADFASAWDFVHVTSSPDYPQANGLAERAVRSAKQLMERSRRDGTDVFLNLLNVRNVPRDHTLGSPAERLMSRQTRTTLPVCKRLLVPSPKSNRAVKTNLLHKRHAQKKYYDKSSRPLRPLMPGEVVRIQTRHGHDSLGTIKEACKEPRSYIVQSGGGEYRRNCRHVLPVSEPPPQHGDSRDDYTADQPPTTSSPQHIQNPVQHTEEQTHSRTQHLTQAPVQSPCHLASDAYITRFGRVCKPNPKYEH
ncbi:unnamed protein product [Oreochromis niloticus]|nr:unnamed protein product [Mustela putorius furo]